MSSIKDVEFVPGWMITDPEIPVPQIDWITRKHLDLSYGQHPLQKIDLYLPPEGVGPFHTVVLVHGGGFTHCDKRDWHLYPGFFALKQGFALASVNYRLAPEAKFPAALYDLKTAIRFLKGNAAKYGLAKENIYLWGTSAGGNLVSMVGTTWNIQEMEDKSMGYEEEDCRVKAIAALCPAINLSTLWEQLCLSGVSVPPKEVLDRLLEQYICEDYSEVQLAKASADTYLSPEAPPFYIQHGTADEMVPAAQVIEFANKLGKFINKENIVLDLLIGAAHAGAGTDFLEERNILPILKFFRKYR